ncbi:hypothetical protein EJ04DRAFT_507657 [Polyplosphaeria fusca]|uniref:Transmembrane protein n=1 Tax=Polyplosphaeria fusca TaxID=682080 RepID=A0A9P4RC07_9PLEO|nr:hypothetical protein EJ04DRAFT_507657 [Polyplosphaeria fusca]
MITLTSWHHLRTWKLPLVQLISQLPKAPLGYAVESATITHLLGDPIDSLAATLVTLAQCQARAKLAQNACGIVGLRQGNAEYDRAWKALSIIMVSYDECGRQDKAIEAHQHFLAFSRRTNMGLGMTSPRDLAVQDAFAYVFDETAHSLAADRSTKSLPVFFSELIFIGGWIIALIKTGSSDPGPANWVNVEAQSVAISAMFLWVTALVVLGAIVGVGQSEDSAPRILQRYEYDIRAMREQDQPKPSASLRGKVTWCLRSTERAASGGMYSWKPKKWEETARGTVIFHCLIAISVVGVSYLTAAVLSDLVSPRGLGCRHVVESVIFAFWFLSFAVECVLELLLREKAFWPVFWKDTFVSLAVVAVVLVTQWGIMNRCACWSSWGKVGVHLPQMPEVRQELMHYIHGVAPWITFMAVLLQLLFCGLAVWMYLDAIRVFIQRDDGKSNCFWRNKTVRRN